MWILVFNHVHRARFRLHYLYSLNIHYPHDWLCSQFSISALQCLTTTCLQCSWPWSFSSQSALLALGGDKTAPPLVQLSTAGHPKATWSLERDLCVCVTDGRVNGQCALLLVDDNTPGSGMRDIWIVVWTSAWWTVVCAHVRLPEVVLWTGTRVQNQTASTGLVSEHSHI